MRWLTGLALLIALPLAACSFETTGLTPSEARIVVENRGTSNVVAVYISPCAESNLGGNRLDASVIVPNGRQSFPVEPGCYDLLLKNAAGAETEFQDLLIPGGVTHTVTLSR